MQAGGPAISNELTQRPADHLLGGEHGRYIKVTRCQQEPGVHFTSEIEHTASFSATVRARTVTVRLPIEGKARYRVTTADPDKGGDQLKYEGDLDQYRYVYLEKDGPVDFYRPKKNY